MIDNPVPVGIFRQIVGVAMRTGAAQRSRFGATGYLAGAVVTELRHDREAQRLCDPDGERHGWTISYDEAGHFPSPLRPVMVTDRWRRDNIALASFFGIATNHTAGRLRGSKEPEPLVASVAQDEGPLDGLCEDDLRVHEQAVVLIGASKVACGQAPGMKRLPPC